MNTLFPKAIRIPYLNKILFLLAFSCLAQTGFSQEIRLKFSDEPLNKILISLRDNYNIMLSFDDSQLSKYRLTIDKSFNSVPQAFDYLLKGLPLSYEVAGGVYMIYTIKVKEKPKNYLIAGRIFDKSNRETLPFSNILIKNSGLISDAKGYFSFTSASDSIFNVKISYLGYYILDTVVAAGTNYSFYLIPSVIALEEIIVKGSAVARTIITGSSPGISRLNHKIAYFLPGNGDNSVFNLLRLQPGILAAGEQSNDLIVWGSYEGQSQVIFDGFTLYGMKNFNDNISAVNPFMAKDIKVLKGGYSAEYGERVGGIVDITGIDGNRVSPSAQLCINNMTLNGMVSVPLRKKSSLIMAYRQTYYKLYDDIAFTSSGSGRGRQSGSGADYYVSPEYVFRDINLKFSGSGKKSHYYLSLYGGKDNFYYAFDQETQQRTVELDYSEDNHQLGGAAYYGFTWKEKNTSNLTLSYSALHTERENREESEGSMGHQVFHSLDEKYRAEVNEVNSRIDNNLNLSGKHMVSNGLGMIYYFTTLQENTYNDSVFGNNTHMPVPYLYLQDKIPIFTKLTLKPGIRVNYHAYSQKFFFQPRFSAMYRFNDHLRINSAVGMYNQFVAKNMIMDQSGNYKFAWELCDDKNVPVLNSKHFTGGISFNKNDFTVSLEGYLKYTGGITRYLQTGDGLLRYEGKAKTRGLDLFAKKEFKNQTLWISYTLSRTEEHFPYFPTDDYLPAMQDQQHEIKLAGLAKIRSFHFSANYVYGSGLPDPDKLPDIVDYVSPYSRLDGAIIYKLSIRKLHLDAGVSILNILNTENIKYSNLTRIPTENTTTVSIYAEAVPRTTTLFLNLYY
jgi:outer membrane receptor protein involved in Fe transport